MRCRKLKTLHGTSSSDIYSNNRLTNISVFRNICNDPLPEHLSELNEGYTKHTIRLNVHGRVLVVRRTLFQEQYTESMNSKRTDDGAGTFSSLSKRKTMIFKMCSHALFLIDVYTLHTYTLFTYVVYLLAYIAMSVK